MVSRYDVSPFPPNCYFTYLKKKGVYNQLLSLYSSVETLHASRHTFFAHPENIWLAILSDNNEGV